MSLRQLALEILAQEDYIEYLENEVQRLKGVEEKYDKLLIGTIRHNETMMGHMLHAAIKGYFNEPEERSET